MGTVAHETDVYYDPYDTGINTDPYPTYARLREESPIYYNEKHDFWAISRHSDVEQALANWQTFSSRRSDILELVKSDFDMPGGAGAVGNVRHQRGLHHGSRGAVRRRQEQRLRPRTRDRRNRQLHGESVDF
jgi:cytochrome P450